MSGVCHEGTDVDSACLSIPTVTGGVTSFKAFATKDVRSGVNELKYVDSESPDVSDGCPFPRSKSATADVYTSAATEEDISGGDEASKRVGGHTLGLVRINTPPSKSTRVFKGEAEAQIDGIEEAEPTPIFQRALSCPDSTSRGSSLITTPIQRSLSWPGSLGATEDAISSQGDSQRFFGSQASGLGPTSSDDETIALSGKLKQMQTSATIGQKKESLYKLSNILPPEERTATDPVTHETLELPTKFNELPTNEQESPTLEDQSTEGAETLLPDEMQGTAEKTVLYNDKEQDVSMEERDKRMPVVDVANGRGRGHLNIKTSPPLSIDRTSPPQLVDKMSPPLSGTPNDVLLQPVSSSCSDPTTAEGLMGDEVGEPPTHEMRLKPKVWREKSRVLSLEESFHILSYTARNDVEDLHVHGYNELVTIAGRKVDLVWRLNYLTYEYTECLVANGSRKRIGCRKPTQCTDVDMTIRSTERRTVQEFCGFKDRQTYVQAGPSAFIYYTTEDVFGVNFEQLTWLRKGGNATIYTGGPEECYAIKETSYNMDELNVSYQLHHKNIMKLLGVMLPNPIQSPLCYQIMNKMTCDLATALSSFHPHGLLKHMTSKTSAAAAADQQTCILYNAVYTLKQTMLGLSYLKSKNIQHGDVKESNILLLKKCTCSSIIFHCKCPASSTSKYSVMLADFDYVRNDSPDVVDAVGGTSTYHAPEQRVRRGRGITHGGPCSDTWSVGVMGLYMFLGHGTSEERENALQEANMVVRQPHCTKLSTSSEVPYILNMFRKLLVEVLPDVLVLCMVKFIAQCLEIDHKKRLSPDELLQQLEAVLLSVLPVAY